MKFFTVPQCPQAEWTLEGNSLPTASSLKGVNLSQGDPVGSEREPDPGWRDVKAIPPSQPLGWEFFLPFNGPGVPKGHEHIQGQTAKEKLVPQSLHVPSTDECKPESLSSTPPSLLISYTQLMSVLLGDPRDPY